MVGLDDYIPGRSKHLPAGDSLPPARVYLSLQVTHIWPSKWSTVKVIFLANRYGNLLLQVVLIMHILGLNPAYSQMVRMYFREA